MITLVIGLRGTGKSTYCREHLGEDGLCYDMDAIASAFRLRMPHEEYHAPSRRMANDLLHAFVIKAQEFTDNVLVIRTAPSIFELREINPDRLVVCNHPYVYRQMDDPDYAEKKINEAVKYCRKIGIPINNE